MVLHQCDCFIIPWWYFNCVPSHFFIKIWNHDTVSMDLKKKKLNMLLYFSKLGPTNLKGIHVNWISIQSFLLILLQLPNKRELRPFFLNSQPNYIFPLLSYLSSLLYIKSFCDKRKCHSMFLQIYPIFYRALLHLILSKEKTPHLLKNLLVLRLLTTCV